MSTSTGDRYQAKLWRLLGELDRPEGHVRMDVYAMLWAERGLVVYGNNAAGPEAADLRQQAANYRTKLDQNDHADALREGW